MCHQVELSTCSSHRSVVLWTDLHAEIHTEMGMGMGMGGVMCGGLVS